MGAKSLTVFCGSRLWIMALPEDHGATEARLKQLAQDRPFWGWLVKSTVVGRRYIYLRLTANVGFKLDQAARDMVIDCLMHKAAAEVAESLHQGRVLESAAWQRQPIATLLAA